MDVLRHERLEEIMVSLGRGDRQAALILNDEFGGRIAAALRRDLYAVGCYDFDREELAGLVLDACFALTDCASGWDSEGGALPWVWASKRIARVVHAWVGQHCDPYDAALHDTVVYDEVPPADADELTLLGRLSARNETCALLLEALERVTGGRDRAILLEVRMQAVGGDPSPANTVATRHGLSPQAVRQIVCRARRNLRNLAARDVRFAPLADLALVA